MNVELTTDFLQDLEDQVEYISQDKPQAAQKFKDDLFSLLEDLPKMPLKHRQSIYFENDKVRDLIFKGYTITFKIDEANNKIVVFCFTKYKEDL